MSQDAIIEKIKKLLRMKRGGTAGEIENALAAAAKLAREHGIDINDINPDDESKKETITHATDVLKLRMPLEAKLAAGICVNFFNVQMCWQHGINRWWMKNKTPNRITFVGTAWDIEVARYVFIFLQRHFRWSWNHRENRRLKNREAFLNGMYVGLGAKLEQAQEKIVGNGLIHVGRALQLRKDYLSKLFPKAQDMDLDDDDSEAHASRYAGVRAGENTNIRRGVDDADPVTRRQLSAPAKQLSPINGQLELL